ncbi:MAG: 2-dehydropantoate 2-reductase [Elusimicrobia bacterium]|nr:2-dehydropantoate 2-reductase [Elusimicrobiota bacterium]
MDILIVGPGAIGGVLAARWALARVPVLVLARRRQTEELLEQPFVFIDRKNARHTVSSGVSSARKTGGKSCQAVFLCVKSYDVRMALRGARPWIGPRTTVVALQNGVGHERDLLRACGRARSVLASCFFAADRLDERTFANTWGNHIVLARESANRGCAEAARSLLSKAGWQLSLKSSAHRLLWTKLCFNASVNLLGSACMATNGELAREPALKEILLTVLAEAVATAKASNHPPLYADMASLVVRGCRNAPSQRNSMLQDLVAGRRTELAAIAGPLIEASRRRKVPAPALGALTRLVGALERLP